MLEIKSLVGGIEGKTIINNLRLAIEPGQIHAIMGVNGSGKSTLASILTGKPGYEVSSGEVLFFGEDLLELSPDERASKGLFMAFQYPVELPGVMTSYFLRTAYNAQRKARGEAELGVRDFQKLLHETAEKFNYNKDFFKRAVNEGFSGGEKKRNEIFQMALLKPKLAILDETDSGLDIDALVEAAKGVNTLKRENPEMSFLVITHYQRLLNYIIPDVVHIMIDGRVVKSGTKDLALELEERGYNWIREERAL
jgi:Fe-S cluster assembly ATP-binding protein